MSVEGREQAPRLPPELTELVRAQVGVASPARLAAGRQRLLGRLEPRRRGGRRWLLVGAPAVAAVAALVLVVRARPPALTYEIRDGVVSAGDLLAPDRPARVRFSDASTVALAARSAARLEHVDAGGARLRLTGGRADLDVTPRSNARWEVAAGPFTIAVRGTRFSVSWSDEAQRLEVRLQRGAVEVSGPLLEQPIALRPGQRLVASVPARELRVVDADEPAPPPPMVEPTPPPVEAAPPAEPPAPRPATRRTPHKPAASSAAPTPGWPERLRRGAFAEIVSEAERSDVRALCATAPRDELAALADAARYERHGALAGQALEALRARFPGSESARDAAFHLGRLEEGAHGATAAALRWYERYAEESPRGAYAAEALARRIGVLRALHGSAAAKPLADDYLRRFPNGAFADGARALLATPGER